MPSYKSFATQKFWEHYEHLPEDVRQLADKTYLLFKKNSAHPGLHFKKVGKKQPVYSVRVTDFYRALCLKQQNNVYWFWIGDHISYEKMIGEL